VAKLTTTTYAILGLLARKPWSAYELTKYMQHSGVRAVWPRTESRIYLEFKNLVAHELATAREEAGQTRKRSVYTITAAGEQALAAWLAAPEGGLRLESEPLLKLLYGDLEPSSTAIQVAYLRAQLVEEITAMREKLSAVIESGFAFEGNAHHNAQLVSLLTALLEARVAWLKELSAATGAGPNEALRTYRRQVSKLDSLLAELEEVR